MLTIMQHAVLIILSSIFVFNVHAKLQDCDCNVLSTCLQRAWSPCTEKGGGEQLFWMRLHPGHWRYTRCKWEWRQVQLMDFTFRHTKSIMDCISSHDTCKEFRSEVAWNDCWINNANIAPGLREAVVAAWRCEVQKDLEVDPSQSLNDFIAPLKPSPHAEQLQSKRRTNYWDCERFSRALGYRISLKCGSLRSVPFNQ